MEAWLIANWPVVLSVAILIVSELMPFLPTKANGIAQVFVNIGKKLLAKKGVKP